MHAQSRAPSKLLSTVCRCLNLADYQLCVRMNVKTRSEIDKLSPPLARLLWSCDVITARVLLWQPRRAVHQSECSTKDATDCSLGCAHLVKLTKWIHMHMHLAAEVNAEKVRWRLAKADVKLAAAVPVFLTC